MEFDTLIERRYSVLHYEKKAVERQALDAILQAGLKAPTACNFQPQKILVVNDDAGRAILGRVTGSSLYLPAALLVCYDKTRCWTRRQDGKPSGEIDASIVATHMMLEATNLGLGSIWVMSWDPAAMKAAFALPENIEPVALLVIGHIAEEDKPRPTHFASRSMADVLWSS